jgi:hypothetical protein
MFVLLLEEKEQLVTTCERLSSLKHSYVNPMVFTEQGVAMLSSVLRSDKAIKINIEIMRAFANYRALIHENDELRTEIRDLDQKINKAFRFLLDRIDELHQKSASVGPVGYKFGSKQS